MEERPSTFPTLTGITCDSRKICPGYAFVAISGFNKDGNKYINDAIKRGASIVFTDQNIKTKKDIPIIKVKDARTFLGKLAAKFYNYPSNKLNLIGVTGTNGKTTTTHLLYHLLNYRLERDKKNSIYENQQAGLIGTVKVDTGEKIIPGRLTTPDPENLQKHLSEMVKNKLKFTCMEVSSHGIKLKRIEGCIFAVKVGTNISTDHFDLHPDMSEYILTKKRFLQENEGSLVLINKDDPVLNSWGTIAKNQFNYGIRAPAEIEAKNIKHHNNKVCFTYFLGSPIYTNNGKKVLPCQFNVRMNLPGEHNIYNALVAITIGLYYGLSPEIIKDFFLNFKGIWRRFELIYKGKYTIIDDCAHNPGSYEAVFKAISRIEYKRLFIVNSLRGNRGNKINKKNAETISSYLQYFNNYLLYTTNCSDVVKEIDLVKKEEEICFLKTLDKYQVKYTHLQELRSALIKVTEQIDKGDLLLLLGPHAMDKAGKMILNMLNSKYHLHPLSSK
ncbi:MAG TPA: UDP-N-acetylmuramyl-tripeptide synthetase [Halanaerobiales bacterium]|nr:UDP-N-acetylmuramyl-tripeptide synthetase [Halanaerobiales bacterium]